MTNVHNTNHNSVSIITIIVIIIITILINTTIVIIIIPTIVITIMVVLCCFVFLPTKNKQLISLTLSLMKTSFFRRCIFLDISQTYAILIMQYWQKLNVFGVCMINTCCKKDTSHDSLLQGLVLLFVPHPRQDRSQMVTSAITGLYQVQRVQTVIIII